MYWFYYIGNIDDGVTLIRQYVQDSWKAYKKNWKSLVIAYFLIGIIALAVAGVGISSVTLSALTTFGTEYFESGNVDPQVVGEFFVNNAGSLGFMFFAFIVAGLVSTALQGGYVKMCADALKGKTRVQTMIDVAKKKWETIIFARIVAGIIGFVVIVLSIPTIVLIIPVAIAISVLFMFIEQAIVIDNKKAIDAIKHSYHFGKNNFFEIFGLSILIFAITLVAGMIPLLGTLINLLIIGPVTHLAFTKLYLARRKKRY
jgi:hypothetical protein